MWWHTRLLGHRTSEVASFRPKPGGVSQRIITCECGRKVWLR